MGQQREIQNHASLLVQLSIHKKHQPLLTCLEVECSGNCICKQILLPSQRSEVASVGFKRNEVTIGAINIGVIKGAHGSAPIKINI